MMDLSADAKSTSKFKNLAFDLLIPLLPKRLMSRGVGVIMRIPLVYPINVPLLWMFARFFSIQVSEAEKPLSHYKSFDDFFTRRLKPELRPVMPFKGQIHPVDGVLTTQGEISSDTLVQAKKWNYSLTKLLGDRHQASEFQGGHFYTYYLCPADYHRVHAPRAGALSSAKHFSGELWPVNDWSVNAIQDLFCLNERVVLNFTSLEGNWSIVFVGATNVGYMSFAHDPSLATNQWQRLSQPVEKAYDPAVSVAAGVELGAFHLGSTVIVLVDKKLSLGRLKAGPVRFGEPVHFQ